SPRVVDEPAGRKQGYLFAARRIRTHHCPGPEIDGGTSALVVSWKDLGQLRPDVLSHTRRPLKELFSNHVLAQSSGLTNALRILQDALLDEMGDRVKVHGSRVAAEPKRLEWDCAAAGETVEYLRRAVRIRVSEELAKRVDPHRVCRRLEG